MRANSIDFILKALACLTCSLLLASCAASKVALDYDVKDDSEGPWTTAELYLVVSCSSAPQTWQVLPLNTGNPPRLSGYLDTVFRARAGDRLTVEIYDADDLNSAQVKLLNDAVEAGGKILINAAIVYIEAASRSQIPSDLTQPLVRLLEQDWVKVFELDDVPWERYAVHHEEVRALPAWSVDAPERAMMYEDAPNKRIATLRIYRGE